MSPMLAILTWFILELALLGAFTMIVMTGADKGKHSAPLVIIMLLIALLAGLLWGPAWIPA